jgi:signal transduction histidine kinase
MSSTNNDVLLRALQERVKELELLHRATALLQQDKPVDAVLREFVEIVPGGWEYPELAAARISLRERSYASPGFKTTPWLQRAEFPAGAGHNGILEVVYLTAPPHWDAPAFLPEEGRLLDSLASLIRGYLQRTHAAEQRLAIARAEAARTEAQAASKAKDAFLAMVSHELRGPLAAIMGWTRLLRTGKADLAQALDVIERNANVQRTLIDELMDISRIVSGELELNLAVVDFDAIVQQAVDAARPAAADRRLAIDLTVQEHPTPVVGDPLRLHQIVANILSNAVKFTPDDGAIALTLTARDGVATLQVADSGVGIDPALVEHIFEPFWQARRPSSAYRGGLGLGLSIVRRLVHLHGGSIHATSEGTGRGTQMTVTFDLATGKPHASPDRRQAERRSPLDG